MSFDLKIVAGDLVFENGDLALVRGSAKLEQDITKMALTEVGSNPLQPWYGSFVSSNLIGRGIPSEIVLSAAQSQLERSMQTLKQLQSNQAASGQKMSPEERISAIQQVSVFENPTDPRILNVIIRVLNQAYSTVSSSIKV